MHLVITVGILSNTVGVRDERKDKRPKQSLHIFVPFHFSHLLYLSSQLPQVTCKLMHFPFLQTDIIYQYIGQRTNKQFVDDGAVLSENNPCLFTASRQNLNTS
jgi:hypothetical protein